MRNLSTVAFIWFPIDSTSPSPSPEELDSDSGLPMDIEKGFRLILSSRYYFNKLPRAKNNHRATNLIPYFCPLL